MTMTETPKIGDRSTCKHCGEDIAYTTDPEWNDCWRHLRPTRIDGREYVERYVGCRLVATPVAVEDPAELAARQVRWLAMNRFNTVDTLPTPEVQAALEQLPWNRAALAPPDLPEA